MTLARSSDRLQRGSELIASRGETIFIQIHWLQGLFEVFVTNKKLKQGKTFSV